MSEPAEERPDEAWELMTITIDLKHLGKLAEELNECGSAVARCIIQGLDRPEPVTGKLNRLWLTEEIADVVANVELVVAHFGLDRDFIEVRAAEKRRRLKGWHDQLRSLVSRVASPEESAGSAG